jgi:two-component system, sporulation sensor kinase A
MQTSDARASWESCGLVLSAVVLTFATFATDLLAYPTFSRLLVAVAIWMMALLIARQRRTEHQLRQKAHEARQYLERADVDAEERKRAEEALHRSLKDLEDIKYALDRSTIVATTDRMGTITYANDQFCEISKYSREELIGQNHRIINSGYHPHEFFQNMWRTIASGQKWHAEIRNRAKDGTLYWVDTTIVPFLDEQGRPYQYIAIRHDITERKRVETELREQAALKRLGEMGAVVAHELKNPLAGLRGALEIIGRRMSSDSPDRRIIQEMVTRIDSLNQMVHDLLVFARPSLPNIGQVLMSTVVAETTALLASDPAMRDVVVDVSGVDPVVPADAAMMKGVLLNLMINAAQAMGHQGRIALTLSTTNDHCEIRVADHGPGIPEGLRDKIFDPFFTTKHRGTGLGLSVARRTVEMHGGTMRFECPSEGGTVMTVCLPLARQV